MKTKKTILLALLTGLITSCTRPVYQSHELTEVDYQMIPYKLGQTVGFIDYEGQPFILTVTEDTTRFSMSRQMDNLYYMYSSRTVRLQSEKLRIFLSIDSHRSFEVYNVINVSINTNIETTWSYYAIYYDKEGKFSEYGGGSIHDSIDIDGKVYYDVVECNTNKGANEQPAVPTQFFYNKTYGILQINIDGENFCTIK